MINEMITLDTDWLDENDYKMVDFAAGDLWLFVLHNDLEKNETTIAYLEKILDTAMPHYNFLHDEWAPLKDDKTYIVKIEKIWPTVEFKILEELKHLDELIKDAGLTPHSFGVRVGVKEAVIKNWINGLSYPSKEEWKRIQNILNK